MSTDGQDEHLSRVRSAIGPTILDFCRSCYASDNPTFYMRDLSAFVHTQHPDRSPGSTCRIFRALHQEGRLHYEVNRGQSLYRLLWVQMPGDELRPPLPSTSQRQQERFYFVATQQLICGGPYPTARVRDRALHRWRSSPMMPPQLYVLLYADEYGVITMEVATDHEHES